MQATAVSETSAEAIKSPSASARVTSLDIVRGVAMILMAIDHVRVYSGVPAGGPTFGVFFTRWITNFVAPAFVFLAGTSAWLYGRKLSDRWSLSRFLISRGLWLIFLELTFLRVAWTFNFDFQHYLLAGVIWMIGWCMIALAGAVYLPRPAIASIGISLIALHNLSNLFRPQLAHAFGPDGPNWFLRILYFGGAVDIGKSGPPLLVLFVLVPWVGLMFAGYAFGPVIKQPAESRRRIYLQLGLALTGLFVALRFLGIYGDPRPWDRHSLFKLPEHREISCVTRIPLHDHRADVFAVGSRGRVVWARRQNHRDLRSRSDALLSAPHSADSRRRVCRFAASGRTHQCMALRQPSSRSRAAAPWIHVELAASLPGLCGVPRASVLSVPMVCKPESHEAHEASQLHLGVHPV